jgi:hypothetical protein
VTQDTRRRTRIVRDWWGPTAVALSRLFRFGTPALAALCAVGVAPWWLVLVPVIPVWISFITSTHDAHRRARIIRRPRRPIILDEAAIERRFLMANAALVTATAKRRAALVELARARALGDAQARDERVSPAHAPRWRGPPST